MTKVDPEILQGLHLTLCFPHVRRGREMISECPTIPEQKAEILHNLHNLHEFNFPL